MNTRGIEGRKILRLAHDRPVKNVITGVIGDRAEMRYIRWEEVEEVSLCRRLGFLTRG